MASAGQQVLDTFELFESICEYLQPIDLLLTSGTSKQARAVIRNSPVLQRKLFLKTESVGRVMYTDHYWRDVSTGIAHREFLWVNAPRTSDPAIIRLEPHPLLDLIFPVCADDGGGVRGATRVLSNHAGSFLPMYLTSPPASQVTMAIFSSSRGYLARKEATASDGVGVRVIDVVRRIREVISKMDARVRLIGLES